MSDVVVSPGWYPDRTARHQFRYWDGTRWTSDVADQGTHTIDQGEVMDATVPPDAAYQTFAGPQPVPSPGPRRPRRKGSVIAVLFWVFGILLLLVGTIGFVGSNQIDTHDEKTYATELTELKGDVSGSAVKAAELRTRTDAVASAIKAYAASMTEAGSAHNAVIDGLDRAIGQVNDTGSSPIAQNELPPMIARFKAALTDQATKQAALVAALTSLQEATQ